MRKSALINRNVKTPAGRTSSVRVAIVQHFRDVRLAERAHLLSERDARRAGEADHIGSH